MRRIDVTHDDAAAIFDEVLDALGGADLVFIRAGAGHNNRDLNVAVDVEPVTVDVLIQVALLRVAHLDA